MTMLNHIHFAIASHQQYTEERLDIESMVVIRATNKRKSPKFNTFVYDYVISFNVDQLPLLDDLGDIFDLVYQTFEYIFERLLHDFSTTDHIRIVIESDSLDTPIVIPYLPVGNVTIDMVFDAIADVLNSQEEFDITEGFRIHVSRAVLPGGAGRRQSRSSVISFRGWLDNKSKSTIKIPNEDNLCLARAIVVAVEQKEFKHTSKNHFYRFAKSVRPGSKQTILALQLHTLASLPTNKPTYGLADVATFQTICDYQIHVYNEFLTLIFSASKEMAKGHIYLLLWDGHYEVVKSMTGLLGRIYFCDVCQKGFRNRTHRCKSTSCTMCWNIKCTNSNSSFSTGKITCEQCGKQFYSACCVTAHSCVKSTKCDKCDTFFPLGDAKKHSKICNKFRCAVCNEYFSFPRENHFCFVQQLKRTDETDDGDSESSSDGDTAENPEDVFFFYDFETTFVDDGYHRPTLLVCVNTQETFVFKGESLLDDFFGMISNQLKMRPGRFLFCAHNASGFDSMLLLRGIYDQGLTPKIFYRGSKILMMEISRRVRFICSFQFLPFSLRMLAKNFNIPTQKLYFPYLLGKESYLEKEIDFPSEACFNPKSLRPTEYQEFKKAYDVMKANYHGAGKRYNVQEELERYCTIDTVALRDICLTFSIEFETMTGLKPFSTGITLPSVCLTLYRQQHLPSSCMLPVFPSDGIATKTKDSKICSLWLQWTSIQDGKYIEGAHNVGEQVIGRYRVDGFYRHVVPKRCAYHSCPRHYPDPSAMNQLTKVSHGQTRANDRQKREFLRNTSYQLIEKWECDFVEEVKKSDALLALSRTMGFTTMNRLIPRDGLYGGRVEAFKLYAERSEKLSISYYDFVSLYPTVMINGDYSVGRPTIIYGFMLGPVQSIDFSVYRGLLYIKILPPKNLRLPVLPFRTKHFGLTFPLCATCATTCQHASCIHTTDERVLVGVWSHIELEVALEEKYEILEVYEIYHFEQHSNDVFKTYIKTFTAAKIANSGFPPDISDDAGRQGFVDGLYATTGIQVPIASIVKNPVRKANAKLCLNSLWGKFSQKTIQKTTKIISEPADFYKLHADPSIQIDDFFNINEELLHVTYSEREDTRTRGRTCLIVAIETTALARIRLYRLLKSIGVDRLIYTDTDSVVFESVSSDWMPETGNYFGQLQDEIAGKFGTGYINRVVALGCKTYAMEIINGQNDRVYETRCKGISLNIRTMQEINFDSMLNLLKNDIHGSLYMEEPYFITRVKREARLISAYRRKKLRFTFRKRIVNFENFLTLPLGFISSPVL